MKTEIKVGLFVLLGILSLLFMTFQIKSLERIKNHGYTIYAVVGDASGLTIKSKVKMRGVKIGLVDNMTLLPNGVKLKLIIQKGVKIPVGSKVMLAQENVLGGKYLDIIPSNSNQYYKPGSVIKNYISSATLGDVMTNLNKLINKLKKVLNNQTIDNIHQIAANLKDSSVQIKQLLSMTNKKLPVILDNANKLLVAYRDTGYIIKKKIPGILDRTNKFLDNTNKLAQILKIKVSKLADTYIKVGKNANSLIAENKKTLSDTIKYAGDFFKSGSDSFKKLDNMIGALNKSQIMVDIYTQYMMRDGDFKTTANLAYLPNPTKYYILGVTSYKDYSYENPTNKSKVYINAEIGKRYDNILLRGGIIESTGGVGLDYFALKDKLKFSTDLYDFNSQNDIRGKNPHLDFKTTYLYLKHLEFIAGIDNVLNNKARTFFLGLGVKFKDNDLKPLISGGATSFLK